MKMTYLKEVSLCLFVFGLSFLNAQQLSPAQLETHQEFLKSADYDYYMDKMGFESLPDLQLIGDFEIDRNNYKYLLNKSKTKKGTGDNNNDLRIVAPENDISCNALLLDVGVIYGYSNEGAGVQTGEVSPGPGSGTSCEATNGWCSFETEVQSSIWYKFIAPASGLINIVASGFDNQLALWSVTNCNDFTSYSEIAANDDSGDLIWPGIHVFAAGIIVASVIPGELYYIQLDGYQGATGSGDIEIIEVSRPDNDNVCSAQALIVDAVTSFSTLYSTVELGEVSPGPGSGTSCEATDGWCNFETDVQTSVWYTFVAPASGRVTAVASGYDGQLAMWSVTDCNDYSSFTEVAANDDSGDDVWPGIHIYAPAMIDICVTPGETYYVQLDGFGGATGAGDIAVLDAGATASIDAGTDATVYFGYDPMACATLTATVSDGDGVDPANITWSTGATGASIDVCPEITTTYTACYDDPNGCTSCDDVTVCSIDVRCFTPGGEQKVEICHKAGTNKEKTLCIDAGSVADHLAHGDLLGACGTVSPCGAATLIEGEEEAELRSHDSSFDFEMRPNPANEKLYLTIDHEALNHARVRIYNQTSGMIISQQINAEHTILNIEKLVPGLYFVELQSDTERKVQKLIVL